MPVMSYLYTRQQLYELVWGSPITTLAKALAVSDAGLVKACRRGDIPLPPRGYWAKLNAGQRVNHTPLPLRAPGASIHVEVGSRQRRPFRPGSDDVPAPDTAAPEAPIYDETLEAVEARIQQALPAKFRFARSMDNTHLQIARLLREDDARREAMARERYAWDKPRFESRFEQRRLAFLSNLFLLLARLDVQCSARGREARELTAHVGCQHVALKADMLATLRPRKRTVHDPKSEPMAIEVEVARWKHGEAEEKLFWCDGEDGSLEDQLREIAVAIVLTGERQYRKGRQFFYEMDLRIFQERIEKARKAREEAERHAHEQRLQAESDRVTRLLGQVSAWQQAKQIRAYVEEVLASPYAISGRAFDGERETWANWARAVANGLDPLATPEPGIQRYDESSPEERIDAAQCSKAFETGRQPK
jgi:hypothetical protein